MRHAEFGPQARRPPVTEPTLDVAVIGCGFSGLAMARALAARGNHQFRIFEKSAEPGGTWRENRYPGAACDVPSHLYSLSDAPNADWTRLFPRQAEIRRYLDTLAAPFRADGRIEFGFELAAARWDDTERLWTLQAADGRRTRARHIVLGLGGLHHIKWPDLSGRESFRGTLIHTAQWPADLDLRGKRVAVIGTGASAAQTVPAIVDRVQSLHVFQRTPTWILPRPDVGIPAWVRRVMAMVPPLRLMLRAAVFVWLELLSIGLRKPWTAGWARWLARRQLRRQVTDPALRARLAPAFPIGCKRVLFASDYYPALQQPQCRLVTDSLDAFTPTGVRLDGGSELDFDVIVCASGFDPRAAIDRIDIRGRDGMRLADLWKERPVSHLGITTVGMPNLYFLLGPNTALGHNSVLYMIETQVRHVLGALDHCARHDASQVEPTAEAQSAFMQRIDQRFRGTAWTGCRSWYVDAEGRNIALWVGSATGYRRAAGTFRVRDYRLG